MSEDAYFKLYFLVDGDPRLQSIPTYAEWDINELTKAIKQVAPSDIILTKVSVFL
jgi:hypothetical protein